MVKTTYIGSVVVNEVAYKYSLTTPTIPAEGEKQTEAVFNSLDELKKELPEALKQIESVITSALEDVVQQISIAQNAFIESSFLAEMREPNDDVAPIDADVLHWAEFENNDQVIDETDQ